MDVGTFVETISPTPGECLPNTESHPKPPRIPRFSTPCQALILCYNVSRKNYSKESRGIGKRQTLSIKTQNKAKWRNPKPSREQASLLQIIIPNKHKISLKGTDDPPLAGTLRVAMATMHRNRPTSDYINTHFQTKGTAERKVCSSPSQKNSNN